MATYRIVLTVLEKSVLSHVNHPHCSDTTRYGNVLLESL